MNGGRQELFSFILCEYRQHFKVLSNRTIVFPNKDTSIKLWMFQFSPLALLLDSKSFEESVELIEALEKKI